MKKHFHVDTEIYSIDVIHQAILDYQEVTSISYKDSELCIEGKNEAEAGEIFSEFMNYVVSLGLPQNQEKGLDFTDMKHIRLNGIGYFRFKKFDDGNYLITNDIGRFQFLSSRSFRMFLNGEVMKLPECEEMLQNGFIKTPNFEETTSLYYREKLGFLQQGPSLHILIITLRCNHHCRYCHAAVAPEDAFEYDMTQETAQKSVDVMLSTTSKVVTIEFQGGEPLLNWKILQYVVEYGKKAANQKNKKIIFTLVTNLTAMTEEKLQWLLDNHVDICTSLDGNEVTHNNNRTGYKENSFKKVKYWITRVNEERQKRGGAKIGALLTTTKETLPYYKDIIDAYFDIGLDGIFLRWLNPYGFATGQMEKLGYTKEERLQFYEKSLNYILEMNKKGEKFSEYLSSMYLKKIFALYDPGFMDVRSPTGLILGGLAYNFDGKVYASDESRMLGRLGDDSFFLADVNEAEAETLYTNIMSSEATKSVIQASLLEGLPGYNEHVYKPYIGVDIINNHKLTGSVYQPFKKDVKTQIQIGILDIIFSKLKNPEERKIMLSWIQS